MFLLWYYGLLASFVVGAAVAADEHDFTYLGLEGGNRSGNRHHSRSKLTSSGRDGHNDIAAAGSVGLLLQLTDIHISAMDGPAGDPQRAPDLLSLSSGLLARWPVVAAVLTGDLTEAKDVYGRGRQDEREWQTYRDARTALSSLGGVPYNQVYDIRGNHDTFNSGPRCGTRDYYCTYSARAERSVRHDGGDNSTAATADPGSARGRIFIDEVYGNNTGRGSGGSCPMAVVVGVDASLDPGMRSPTNFLGVVATAVLDELDRQLAASVIAMRATGCSPPYIAYGHYPLSIIAYPGRGSIIAVAAAAAATVQQVLVRHGVSAYLAGHLHGAFGRKLHRLHPASIAGVRAANGRPVGHMLELEMVDWKHARTVRLLTLDPESGGIISFADFRYIPPSVPPPLSTATVTTSSVRHHLNPDGTAIGVRLDDGELTLQPQQQQLEPFDGTCAVGAYLPLITCPPDARYSPQLTAATYVGGAAASGDVGGAEAAASVRIRVLLLPMGPTVPAVPSDAVYLHWACESEREVAGMMGSGGGGGDDGGGKGSDGPVAQKQQQQQQMHWMPSGPVSATGNGSRGLGRSAGSSSSRGPGHRLSGIVQMLLESATGNYSTFAADLLSEDGGAVSGTEGPADSSSSRSSRSGGVRSCPFGLILVQVRVGSGRKDKDNGAGGGAGESASAERLIHWHPPPAQAPLGSTLLSWRRRRLSTSTTAAGLGAKEAAVLDGLPSAQVIPAPLQQTALEWLVMHVPWHRFGVIAVLTQWVVLTLGLLAAPRVIAVLKVRNARRQGARRQGPCSGRQQQWRKNGLVGDPDMCGSGEEREAELELAPPTAAPTGTAAVANQQLDWAGEGASTSVRLGGVKGGKSTTLKRSSSSSSSSGCDVGFVTREGHFNAGDAASSGLAAVVTPATPRALHASRLRPDGGGGGTSNRRGKDASVGATGDGRDVTFRLWRLGWGGVQRWLGWPLRDLAELAEHRDSLPWLALFLYGMYLAVGPWLIANFVERSGDGGAAQPPLSGYGILTAYGIFMRLPNAATQPGEMLSRWVGAPSQDHVVVTAVVLSCVAPCLLFCASTAARLRRMAAARTPCNGRGGFSMRLLLSWRQAAALCGIAVLNMGLCWKLWAGLGWAPVLLSPGVGWLLPLLAGWLWMTYCRASAALQQCHRQATF